MSDTSTTNQTETTLARPLHDANGKFAKGNPGGPGNPKAGEVQKHRAKLFAAAKSDDAEKALGVLREIMLNPKARDADRIAAAEKMLDRLIGKPLALELEGEEPTRFVKLFLASTLAQVNLNSAPQNAPLSAEPALLSQETHSSSPNTTTSPERQEP